MKIDLERR